MQKKASPVWKDCLRRNRTRRRLIDARVMLSAYYLSLNYHIEAKEAVEPIVDLAVGLNYQKRCPVYIRQSASTTFG